MATVKTTDSDFQTDVLGADTPVLVDFWAEWWSVYDWTGFRRNFSRIRR